MKKLLIVGIVSALVGAGVGSRIGSSIGYANGVADQTTKQIRAIRVESTRHNLSLDDSLKIYIGTEDGRTYNCDTSMPRDQGAPCWYNFNPGVGFLGRDAYTNESSVGGHIDHNKL